MQFDSMMVLKKPKYTIPGVVWAMQSQDSYSWNAEVCCDFPFTVFVETNPFLGDPENVKCVFIASSICLKFNEILI